MLYGGGLIGLLLLAFWIYCIFDVIATDEALMRNLPKILWLVVVILLPTVGAIAWLLLGRPEGAGVRPGDTDYRRPTRPIVAPDDDPRFLARIDDEAQRLRKWEEDLKRREEEMRRREGGEEGDQGTT